LREEIDRLNCRPQIKGLLSYERSQVPENVFHGNVLLKVGTDKRTKRLVAAGLALAIEHVVTRATAC
jgi:CRISPR/Cas system-associated exonuclease Cas4 (RecB family)